MKFKCPQCDGTIIEEVLCGVTVANEVTEVHEDEVYYGAQVYSDRGSVDRYQCKRCGLVLKAEGPSISSPEELHEWLKERNMLCNT